MASIRHNARQRKGLKVLKYATRYRNRCSLCERPRGYMRRFQICRICFRELALRGEIPGVKKAGW